MQNHNLYIRVALICFAIAASIGLWKIKGYPKGVEGIIPRAIYTVAYEFDMYDLDGNAFVRSFVPQANDRQKVVLPKHGKDIEILQEDDGNIIAWNIDGQKDTVIQYSYEVEMKPITFEIPKDATFESHDNFEYLAPTPFIQSTHKSIRKLGLKLKQKNLYETLLANYQFVSGITNSGTNIKTDALTTLQRKRASCNGVSRLFVALCRAQGIPARVAGGLILESTTKRTSHLWAEVFYQNHWIPFDVLNQHFAKLPHNYLELFKGDRSLWTYSKGTQFDYRFTIQKKHLFQQDKQAKTASLWALIDNTEVPLGLLRVILLLPLSALIIAIFRNVIGLKTFGVLLPALIGIALVKVSLIGGIVAFASVITVVSVLHKPLSTLGLLHTPKLVIMLTCVIVTLLGLSTIGVVFHVASLSTALFLPVVIMSITAERFAKILTEEKTEDAFKMLASTFLVAFACYPIFNSDFLLGLFLSHPELYLIILGMLVLLGRWIGFRVMEYNRFSAFAQ